MHSHLLAALDDGVKTHEEAIEIVRQFQQLGFTRLITTPHIMSDTYRNTPQGIRSKLEELKAALAAAGITLQLEAAAEYYLDETVIRLLDAGKPMLTFSGNFFLFETNFYAEPFQLNDFIFKSLTKGYKPILAHPERYAYMTVEKAEELYHRGVILQINSLSLIGFYGKPAQKLAQKLVEQKLIHLLGSDCHNLLQARLQAEVMQDKFYRKALDLPLLNYKL
ncbi:MAG: capsular biosynthesis protein [Cyclobacteriaceae bacterium]|nr:capsular biosynthesis protein [Cyclobacteriaceae bacterium]